MARIVYSSIITSLNGSAGGSTFQRNLYGSTFKNKPNMPIPRSPFQNESKIIIQQCANIWRSLGVNERASWETYANTYPRPTRLNSSAFLSGYNMFMKNNCLRLLAGLAPMKTVLLAQSQLALSAQYLVNDGSQTYWTFDFTQIGFNWVALVFISPVVPDYTLPQTNKTRFIAAGPITSVNGIVLLDTALPARLGTGLVVGEQRYLDLTVINNLSGQILELPTLSITVTA